MADTTKIEWTDATWNIINGCTILSPGCAKCYAMRLAGTRLRHHPSRAGLTIDAKTGPVWNGAVRLHEPWLTQPLEWSKPRDIFVCAHGDLFHDAVSWEMLDRVFAVIALCAVETRGHRFQVLTKRSANMRHYISALPERARAIAEAAVYPHKRPMETGSAILDALERGPLPNVWLGVSTEDQERADQRIPDLLATPAAVRWISAEPLLGPIDLRAISIPDSPHVACSNVRLDALTGYHRGTPRMDGSAVPSLPPQRPALDWIVVGGESGRDARPMHPAWARALRDQAAATHTPFLFKQWGAWAFADFDTSEATHWFGPTGLRGRFDGGRWGPGDVSAMRVSKKAAGRTLDGVTHDGVPA